MKNKFCDQCRAGFTIPAERVRALLPEDKDRFDNASASGVWKRSIGVAARYRLINQTLHCRGPKLLIFEGPAPTDHLWGELPATWVWPGGLVRLRTAYGTLVPIETNNFRSRKRWHENCTHKTSISAILSLMAVSGQNGLRDRIMTMITCLTPTP